MIDFDKLDKLIHEKGRLSIMTLLAARAEWSFQELKAELGMSDGNLVTHLRVLGEAGYVSSAKSQLVHNPIVRERLATAGAREGRLDDEAAASAAVVITAHGAADRHRRLWRERGHEVHDTTCPLVRKAHRSLECLVLAGYFPVIVGRADHVEVRGLAGDFPEALVVESGADLRHLPETAKRIGVVSQTTWPVERVAQIVDEIRHRRPEAEIRHVDTVCQPTKDRQAALRELAARCQSLVVVGGANSNNTAELSRAARALGCRVHQIERADELRANWFRRGERVGLTAGTSTLDETVQEVADRLHRIARQLDQ